MMKTMWPDRRLIDVLQIEHPIVCRIMASATTVAEALWLETRGVDIIIAQGYEAGGHRGTFLAQSLNSASSSQPGTLALVPQVVDAVKVPVVAAGGIADGRGIAAAFALGAAGTQLGTAYLLCPEAATSELHRDALRHAYSDATFVTNVTGLRLRLAQSSMPCPIFLCLWERWHHCGQRPNSRAAAISHLSGQVKPRRLEEKCRPWSSRSNWCRKQLID